MLRVTSARVGIGSAAQEGRAAHAQGRKFTAWGSHHDGRDERGQYNNCDGLPAPGSAFGWSLCAVKTQKHGPPQKHKKRQKRTLSGTQAREPLRMVTMEMTLQISQACTSVQFLNRRSSEECCDR